MRDAPHPHEPEVAESDLLDQLTPASGDEEEGTVRIGNHEGLVDEADLLEQSESVGDDDEDYPHEP